MSCVCSLSADLFSGSQCVVLVFVVFVGFYVHLFCSSQLLLFHCALGCTN